MVNKNDDNIQDENRKMRYLRFIVDVTEARLYQEDLSTVEAIILTKSVREAVLKLFPGKDETYDLIYTPRFNRILKHRLISN
ncbi:MAG TPA: hypothetical protein ENN22_13610 [bacterium]|nr:hypothetical protein [bacterium]